MWFLRTSRRGTCPCYREAAERYRHGKSRNAVRANVSQVMHIIGDVAGYVTACWLMT
ncbi:hypothetical protein KIF59_04820 [Enterobacter cloacae subsp. cloacae]|nr:hypothetical protein [Enterobacter cloacae subsp. cloacae]